MMDIQHNNRALREKKLKSFVDICLESEKLKDNEELLYIRDLCNEDWWSSLYLDGLDFDALGKDADGSADERKIVPGQDILVTGFSGSGGADILSRFEREKLIERLPESFIDKGLAHPESKKCFRELAEFLKLDSTKKAYGISYVEVIADGGMYNKLYKLGKDSGIGFTINYPEVPVKQATVEFCEVFELDPWELYTGESFLIVCDKGNELRRAINKMQGANCEVCGYMTKGKDKIIAHKEQESRVNRPKPDALLSVLKERFTVTEK